MSHDRVNPIEHMFELEGEVLSTGRLPQRLGSVDAPPSLKLQSKAMAIGVCLFLRLIRDLFLLLLPIMVGEGLAVDIASISEETNSAVVGTTIGEEN